MNSDNRFTCFFKRDSPNQPSPFTTTFHNALTLKKRGRVRRTPQHCYSGLTVWEKDAIPEELVDAIVEQVGE